MKPLQKKDFGMTSKGVQATLYILENEAGSRLDRVLCERLGLSRAEAKRLFLGGEVRRNGRRADKGDLVACGDRIELGSELSDPRARPDWMREIADATSGRTFDADSAAPALDDLPSTRTRVIGSDIYSPFASPWFFAVLVAVLALEWLMRRRFGLR